MRDLSPRGSTRQTNVPIKFGFGYEFQGHFFNLFFTFRVLSRAGAYQRVSLIPVAVSNVAGVALMHVAGTSYLYSTKGEPDCYSNIACPGNTQNKPISDGRDTYIDLTG